MSLHSVPPPPAAEPISMPRPGPAKAGPAPRREKNTPHLDKARRAIADALTKWMRLRGVSIAELAELWAVNAGLAHDRLIGNKPLWIEHVMVLPKRQRTQVLEMLLLVDVDDVAA